MDLDRVTRRFSESCQTAHEALVAGFRGRADPEQRGRDAWIVLNRLMFACFTSGGTEHATVRDVRRAVSRLSDRNGRRAGASPARNGHARNGHAPAVSDASCRHLLDFARQWEWRLADGPPAHSREVTPDVLGLILEQHVNQRQTGSYYTRPDVTRYIARATIIPALLDAMAVRQPAADSFERTWRRLLRRNPLRYVEPAMRTGAIANDGTLVPLPPQVAEGIQRVDRRQAWDRPAGAAFGLPGETWRDVVERRARCLEVFESLRAGNFRAADLVTWNLDIEQLISDTITAIEDARLVQLLHEILAGCPGQACATAVRAVRGASEPSPSRIASAGAPFRVLDPTCGSGAFLVAALDVLEPIYASCRARLQPPADAEDRRPARSTGLPTRASDPAASADHAEHRAAIRHTIISRNLYGIELLPEAAEMCRLRLRLKLAAAAAKSRRRNGAAACNGFEHIRVGDALAEDAGAPARRGTGFRSNGSGSETTPAPAQLVHGGFDIVIGNPPYIETGRGNGAPPAFQVAGTGNLFALCTERSLDLVRPGGRLGLVIPMSAVSTPRMRPLMELLCDRLDPLWLSHYACRPGKLFAGADMNVTIVLGRKLQVVARSADVVARSADRATGPTAGLPGGVNGSGDLRSDHRRGQETRAEQPIGGKVFTTGYRRWPKPFRAFLFATLRYAPTVLLRERGTIPKLQTGLERALLDKLLGFAADGRLRARGPSSETVYCHSGGRYFRKCLNEKLSNEYKPLTVPAGWGDAAVCLLSSSLFYWMWIVLSDCYHVTDRDLRFLPIADSLAHDRKLSGLAARLLTDLWANAETRDRRRADGTTQHEVNFDVGRSRPLLDEIDRVLARHFGLTDAELDFILHYEAPYRMPQT